MPSAYRPPASARPHSPLIIPHSAFRIPTPIHHSAFRTPHSALSLLLPSALCRPPSAFCLLTSDFCPLPKVDIVDNVPFPNVRRQKICRV